MRIIDNRALSTALLLAAGSSLALAPAASAAEPTPVILVSSDGVHYSTALDTDLFEGLGTLIPGHSQSATLWVKNPTAAAAEVRLSAADVVTPSSDFAASVSISTVNSGDHVIRATPLSGLADCDVLVESQALAAGQAIEMTVTFAMADVTGQVAQNARASLNARVGMRDAAAGPFPVSACDDGAVLIVPDPDPTASSTSAASVTSGALAHTGFDATMPLMIVGGLIAGGLLFFLVGRRRKSEGS
ncbi:LPXTG cell wall anchor domain-containing protein [Leifsonia sp. A12D58]|uniref:LPXTG cell wall anchor domain-containing protein n=1 Tax=Leifsonia sp. A12D58 TaxID=3397674 RepID=UPI0039E0FE4B